MTPTSRTGITSTRSGGEKSSAKDEALRLEGLRGVFDKEPPTVDDFSLSVPRGTFFSLLGPSGCGKTTLLRLIGGYLAPAAGAVVLEGRDVTAEPPERRDVGMVFQNYALFPHLTARANVSFGLEMRRIPRAQRQQRVEEMLERVGLAPAERGRRPAQLSGGQQQRVALARALVIEPKLLLLDEPFANLDCRLREQLRAELRALQQRTGVTTLLVTHDQEEALSLSDRVGVMARGRLLQVDAPHALYHRPRSPFIARFLGEANLFEVEDIADGLLRLNGGLTLHWRGENIGPGNLLMLRPEQCVFGPAAAGKPHRLTGRIVTCSFLGADMTADVALTEQARLRVRGRADGVTLLQPDEPVEVGFDQASLWRIPERDPDESRDLIAGIAVIKSQSLADRIRPLVLAAPATALVVLFFLAPMILMLRVSLFEDAGGQGFYRPETWTLENYRTLAGDGYFRDVLIFTVLLGAAVTLLTMLIAYPLALFIHSLPPRGKGIALTAVVLPKLASVLVVIYGLEYLLSNAGPVNGVLLTLGMVRQPVPLLHNLPGVLIGEIYLILPYAVLVLVGGLDGLDPSLIAAARGLGASSWQAFRRVTLPLSLPAVLLAGQISLIWALGALLGPMLLGGPPQTTLAVEVQRQALEKNDWPKGAAVAIAMLAALGFCLMLYTLPALVLRRKGGRP